MAWACYRVAKISFMIANTALIVLATAPSVAGGIELHADRLLVGS